MHPQLTLSFDTAPTKSFNSFHVDETTAVIRDSFAAFIDDELKDTQIYIWGESGTGKSHLLAAACQTLSQNGYRVAYLPGEMVNERAALEGMEFCDLLCIDDLQRLDHVSEVDLFHCMNRCRETGTKLIIAADRSASALGLKLADLKTRLSWGLVFHIPSLNDDGLKEAFRREIEARSLDVSDEVLGYVLRRFPRRMSTLKQIVDTLDEASLSQQRRITIPLVKDVFGEAERVALSQSIR